MRIFTGKAVKDETQLIEAKTGFAVTPDWLQQFWRRRNEALDRELVEIPGAPAAVRALHDAAGGPHRLRLGRRPAQGGTAAAEDRPARLLRGPHLQRARNAAQQALSRCLPGRGRSAGRRSAALRGGRRHGDRRHRGRGGRRHRVRLQPGRARATAGPRRCGRPARCRCSRAWPNCRRCWRNTRPRPTDMPTRRAARCRDLCWPPRAWPRAPRCGPGSTRRWPRMRHRPRSWCRNATRACWWRSRCRAAVRGRPPSASACSASCGARASTGTAAPATCWKPPT